MSNVIRPDEPGYDQLLSAFYKEGQPRELSANGKTWMQMERDGQLVFLETGKPQRGMNTNYDRAGSTSPRTPQIVTDPQDDQPSTKTRKKSKKPSVE